MFCGKCGSPITPGAKFCGKCGAPAPRDDAQVGQPARTAATPMAGAPAQVTRAAATPTTPMAATVAPKPAARFNAHGAIAAILVVAAGAAVVACGCLWASAWLGSYDTVVGELGFRSRSTAVAGSLAMSLVAAVPVLLSLVALLPLVGLLAKGLPIRRLPVRAFAAAVALVVVCLVALVVVSFAGNLPALGALDFPQLSVLLTRSYGEVAPLGIVLSAVALACEAACLFGPFTADRRPA